MGNGPPGESFCSMRTCTRTEPTPHRSMRRSGARQNGGFGLAPSGPNARVTDVVPNERRPRRATCGQQTSRRKLLLNAHMHADRTYSASLYAPLDCLQREHNPEVAGVLSILGSDCLPGSPPKNKSPTTISIACRDGRLGLAPSDRNACLADVVHDRREKHEVTTFSGQNLFLDAIRAAPIDTEISGRPARARPQLSANALAGRARSPARSAR